MIRFEDIEIMPGVVIKNDDPKRLGRIKVSVPLWFTTETMHINAINWVYPMIMHRFQSFSKMELGRTVWVLHEKNNYYDYQYIPMFEINEDMKKILETSYNNTEVIFSRLKGDVTAQLYYNDDEGIVMKYANTFMTINSENQIILSDGDCSMAIKGSQVHLGKDNGQKERAVMGETLKSVLTDLATGINTIGSKLSPVPNSGAAVAECTKVSQNFTSKLNDILTDDVYIYK